jgi:hypothetical protein
VGLGCLGQRGRLPRGGGGRRQIYYKTTKTKGQEWGETTANRRLYAPVREKHVETCFQILAALLCWSMD